jgi:biotin transporter BioY
MTNVALDIPRSAFRVRAFAVVVGALLVAAAAQISIPLPGTPVPMTLQPMAVLLVGGLLGAPLGALSMILYLAMGAAGLPVFTPTVPLVGIARLVGPTGGYLLAYPVAAWVVGRFSDPGRQPGVTGLDSSGSLSVNPGIEQGPGSLSVNPGIEQGPGSLSVNPGIEQGPGSLSVNPGLAPGVREPWIRTSFGVVAGLVLIHLGGLAQLALITGNISSAAQLATWPFLLGDLIKIAVLVPVLTKLTPTIRARL